MNPDIELRDDGTIALICGRVATDNGSGGADPVQLTGTIRVLDRIYLDEPPPLPTKPTKYDGFVVGSEVTRSALGRHALVYDSTAGALSKVYDDVYARLTGRTLPLDLFEELSNLREAVLDLHHRLKKAGY